MRDRICMTPCIAVLRRRRMHQVDFQLKSASILHSCLTERPSRAYFRFSGGNTNDASKKRNGDLGGRTSRKSMIRHTESIIRACGVTYCYVIL